VLAVRGSLRDPQPRGSASGWVVMNADEFGDKTDFVEGIHGVDAYGIRLRALPPSLSAVEGEETSTLGIELIAESAGPAFPEGTITLRASDSVLMMCDTSSVGVRQTPAGGIVHLECDGTGEIGLHHCSPATEPLIRLTPRGITQSVGHAPAEVKIEMTSQGITLSAGPPSVGAKVEITAQGITLQVGPMTKMSLTSQGVELGGLNLDMNFQLQAQLQALMVKLQATALLQQQAALIQIG
jgi:hypothetical protein